MKIASVKFTKVFMWVAFTIIVGFDIYWATDSVKGDTISEITKAYSWRWATIPLLYGILTGHLFWSARGEIKQRVMRVILIWPIVLASGVLDFLDYYDLMPIIPLVPGVILGRLLWAQTVSTSQNVIDVK